MKPAVRAASATHLSLLPDKQQIVPVAGGGYPLDAEVNGCDRFNEAGHVEEVEVDGDLCTASL